MGPGPNGTRTQVHFACELSRADNRAVVRFFYSQGTGIKGRPQAADTLDSLKSDASSAAEDFESWADEYGYDPDSRKAYATWEACGKVRRDLIAFLGHALYRELEEARDCERPRPPAMKPPGNARGVSSFTARGALGGPLRPRGARDRATAAEPQAARWRPSGAELGERPARDRAEPQAPARGALGAERPAPGSRGAGRGNRGRRWCRQSSNRNPAELGAGGAGRPVPATAWLLVIGFDNGRNRIVVLSVQTMTTP